MVAAVLVTLLTLPSVKVDLAITDCGAENAYYLPEKRMVVICSESLELPPGVVRYMVAHEMGHAVIDQLKLPITGSEEAAADEFAAIALAESGHETDILAAAVWYSGKTDAEIVTDDHQSPAKRAAVLSCLGAGALDSSLFPSCRDRFKKAESVWWRLVNTFQ